MKKFYNISKAAELSGLTSETLRHYDRINLVKPSKTDENTSYRYYTDEDVVVLKTVELLKRMDMSLNEIKLLIESENLKEVVNLLEKAIVHTKEKIFQLEKIVKKIDEVKKLYDDLNGKQSILEEMRIVKKRFDKRVFFVTKTEGVADKQSLWNFHKNIFAEISENDANDFEFTDFAGVYLKSQKQFWLAECKRYNDHYSQITVAPEGEYLCCVCRQENIEQALKRLKQAFISENKPFPQTQIAIINLTGLLKLCYELQVYLQN